MVLPGLGMIAVTYGLARFGYGLFLPEFRTAFDLDPSLLGLIGGGSYAGYCLSIATSGALSPRLGPRAVVTLAGTVATGGMVLVALAPSGVLLATGVLIAGTAAGFASPPMGDAVKTRVRGEHQGAANTWINSGTSIGVLVSGPIALLMGHSWRIAWLAFAGAAFAVTLWCLPHLPPRDTRPRKNAEPEPANSRANTMRYHRAKIRQLPQGARPLFASAGAMGLVSSVYWTFSRDIIISEGHIGSRTSMVFWMVMGACGLFGGLAGRMVHSWGLGIAVRVCLIGFGTSIAMLAAAPGNVPTVFLSGAGFGACYIFLTGIYLVWSIRVFPDRPSLGIALSFALISVGQVIGSPLAGGISTATSALTSFWIFALLSALAALIGPVQREPPRGGGRLDSLKGLSHGTSFPLSR